MFLRFGYVCIVFHKATKFYKIESSQDITKEFEELGVGESTELVNAYWIQNHISITNFCRKKFEEKRIPKSKLFKLSKEDLIGLKEISKDQRRKTNRVIREERDARWIENLKSKREEYYASNRYKRFRMRHANVIAAGYMIPIGCLIMFPLFSFLAKILEALGLNQYYVIVPSFAFYVWVLWINEKNDRSKRKELLEEEKSLIEEHLETWKRIDANTDAYKEKMDQ